MVKICRRENLVSGVTLKKKSNGGYFDNGSYGNVMLIIILRMILLRH